MARRVFFSFEYEHDVSRAFVVRNSWITQGKEAAGFVDSAGFEKIKRQGDRAVRCWIDNQLKGTSVTVVLVGSHTCASKWVRYEIEKSKEKNNGLLGIDISQIKDLDGKVSYPCGQIPAGYRFYNWVRDNGYENMGCWIEEAGALVGWID